MGGADATCRATGRVYAIIHGQCGPAAKTYEAGETSFKTYEAQGIPFPSFTFCSAGTPPTPSPDFPAQGATVTWTCIGQGFGGTDAFCEAQRAAVNFCKNISGSSTLPPGTTKDSEGNCFCDNKAVDPLDCNNSICPHNHIRDKDNICQKCPEGLSAVNGICKQNDEIIPYDPTNPYTGDESDNPLKFKIDMKPAIVDPGDLCTFSWTLSGGSNISCSIINVAQPTPPLLSNITQASSTPVNPGQYRVRCADQDNSTAITQSLVATCLRNAEVREL